MQLEHIFECGDLNFLQTHSTIKGTCLDMCTKSVFFYMLIRSESCCRQSLQMAFYCATGVAPGQVRITWVDIGITSTRVDVNQTTIWVILILTCTGVMINLTSTQNMIGNPKVRVPVISDRGSTRTNLSQNSVSV